MTLSSADIELIAERTSEILYWKLQKVKPAWVSQNKAWKMYGGRTAITSLAENGKVRVRKQANRNEYYVPDLEKFCTPARY